jgi:hypothetical protein
MWAPNNRSQRDAIDTSPCKNSMVVNTKRLICLFIFFNFIYLFQINKFLIYIFEKKKFFKK